MSNQNLQLLLNTTWHKQQETLLSLMSIIRVCLKSHTCIIKVYRCLYTQIHCTVNVNLAPLAPPAVLIQHVLYLTQNNSAPWVTQRICQSGGSKLQGSLQRVQTLDLGKTFHSLFQSTDAAFISCRKKGSDEEDSCGYNSQARRVNEGQLNMMMVQKVVLQLFTAYRGVNPLYYLRR